MPERSRVPGNGTPRKERGLTGRLSLTSRILFVNVLPLVLLGGGFIYLDSYREQLLDERFKLALVEAQITAEALAGASPCLLYTSPSPRDATLSRMPSSA